MIVFLDIDGVLNHDAWFARAGHSPQKDVAWIDPANVACLNALTRGPGVEVVLSSSWRMRYGPRQMQRLLERVGFEGRIVSSTPALEPEHLTLSDDEFFDNERGLEIGLWLETHLFPDALATRPVVILDDDDSMWCLRHRHVRTSRLTGGLGPAHVAAAEALLSQPLGGLPRLVMPLLRL